MREVLHVCLVRSAVLLACTNGIAQNTAETAGTDIDPAAADAGEMVSIQVPGSEDGARDVLITEAEVRDLEARKDELLRLYHEFRELEPVRRLLQDQQLEGVFRRRLATEAPLDEDQSVSIRERQQRALRGRNRPLSAVNMRMRTVQHDPSSAQVIDLVVAPGYLSTLLFTDATGESWPVETSSVANSEAFTAEVYEPNMNLVGFQVSPERVFTEANAVFLLRELKAPIAIRLTSDQQTVDMRLHVQLPGLGPLSRHTEYPIDSDATVLADDVMLAALDAPWSVQGVGHYQFDNDDVRGEIFDVTDERGNQRLFVRTKDRLINPPYIRRLAGPAGLYLYEVPLVRRFLFSDETGGLLYTGADTKFRTVIRRRPAFYEQGRAR